MEFALALVLLALVAAFVVLRPLRGGLEPEPDEDPRREALEAAKEAKYREIRDAELDLEMGKLSREDHRAIDSELREQAIAILKQLDALNGR